MPTRSCTTAQCYEHHNKFRVVGLRPVIVLMLYD